MTTDLSRKTFLFYDSQGGYTHLAEAVVGQVGAVKYYVPWEKGFPVPKDYLPGVGLDGIERVDSFWDALDEADLVIFADVGNGGLQEWLRARGMPVFGSGRTGKLEQDRIYLKSVCAKLGIDIADWMPVTGLDALRVFLMGDASHAPAPECYVKLSYMRGLTETFHHTSPFITRSWLDEISLEAGPYANQIEFLVEEPIDDEPCIEAGIDCPWSADGMYPDTIMWGYEASKDNCYVGTTGPLPSRLVQLAGRLSGELESQSYRGAFCTETRECPDKSYFIDFTARFGEPPSSLQRFMIANWAEGMWETAHGRVVEAEYNAPVGVQIVWKSSYGKDHPLAVKIGRLDRVTIHGHAVIDGQDYAVSPAELEEAGGACGMGSGVEEALEEAIDAAESIEGREVKFDRGALEQIAEAIEKGQSLGLAWGSNGYAEAAA